MLQKKIYLCIFSIFLFNFFTQVEATSILQTCPYPIFCLKAAKDDEVFANFKRHPSYQIALEHVGYDTGKQYLDFITQEYPELLAYCEKFRENDLFGNPIIYNYGEAGFFSPTTLRYMKVAGDLKKMFGDKLSKMHIVEIGGGYGGQCKILNDLCGFASYSIIDLPECIPLTIKYLNLHGIKNVSFIDNNHLEEATFYDLIISDYAFSEIDTVEQNKYIHYIVGPTPNGYMTMNYISQCFNIKSLSLNEFIDILDKLGRKENVEKEIPNTNPTNLLVTWKDQMSS